MVTRGHLCSDGCRGRIPIRYDALDAAMVPTRRPDRHPGRILLTAAIGLLGCGPGITADRRPAQLAPARTIALDSLGTIELGEPFPRDFPGRDIRDTERMLASGASGAQRVSVVYSEDQLVSAVAFFFPRGHDAHELAAEYTRSYGQPDESWITSGDPAMECLVWQDAETRLELLWLEDDMRGRIVLALIEAVPVSPQHDSCASTRYVGSARPMSRRQR